MSVSLAPTSGVTAEPLEELRRPLTGYCYRMLGSAECEDAVQEVFLRALRHADRYDPARASLSTWLHRIATNVCLDMLRGAKRRALSVEMGPAGTGGDIGAPLPPVLFVEPMPDHRVLAQDPADVAEARESVHLAFLAALQHLPPRQRAVLLLRDVLAFSAKESAHVVQISVPAVNSALQRARATLAQARASMPGPGMSSESYAPEDASQRELLQRYVAAFEAHDIPALTALLRQDAVSAMPPFAWWITGAEQIGAVMGATDACAGDRLVPTAINGSPGFGQYRPDEDGVPQPFALLMLQVQDGQVAQMTTFLGSQGRFGEFGLPERL